MTPLAAKMARDLTLPIKDRRFDDRAGILGLFGQEMHCFDVTAIQRSINSVLDDPVDAGEVDEAWSVWRDVGSILPRLFLPSPVTWLETVFAGSRLGIVLRAEDGVFSLDTVHDGIKSPFSICICRFRARHILEAGDRVEVLPPVADDDDEPRNPLAPKIEAGRPQAETTLFKAMMLRDVPIGDAREAIRQAEAKRALLEMDLRIVRKKLEVAQMANRFIAQAVLAIDLINTPGLIGLKQREVNKGIARQLANVGRYPLQAWSEIVLKHETRFAEPGERLAGRSFRKCLHFVRSHLRHYQTGRVSVVPAHWRGDPAIGIKRTRYLVEAA